MLAYLKYIYCFALGLALLPLAIIGDASAQNHAFQFGLIGDMPYTTVQQQEFSDSWRL